MVMKLIYLQLLVHQVMHILHYWGKPLNLLVGMIIVDVGLYSEKIYATSAPGGFVYVTTGMLTYLENEAELAGILAHEIGEQQFKDPRFSKIQKGIEHMTHGVALVGPLFGQIGALAVHLELSE